jgi:outer membrane receptor protein involved in Fe transport
MKSFSRTPLARGVSAALSGTFIAASVLVPAHAQEEPETRGLEEIIVTAQKRAENLQDVALSVQVLSNEQLDDLDIKGFADYIEFLPTVSFQSERPGVSQIYMRGISSGGDGVHSGSMPSVGVYLDEQPITTINQILDLHIYDIARIETLSGPQGTYFGASSQAGTMRIITNRPVLGEFQAGFDVGAEYMEEGEPGFSLEGFANFPLTDNAALRVVGWYLDRGGYIDNLPGTITFHGVGETVDNSELVEEDYNDVTTAGARALLRIDLNDNWAVTPGLMYQEQDTDGVFFHDPEEVGDLQVRQFYPDFYDDAWYQASLTLEGNIGDLNLVYAGAYLDRDADSLSDYSHYAQYVDNYYGYYGSCYHYDSTTVNCTNPNQYITGDEAFTRQSHELRLQSSQEERLRWIAGLFWQRQEHDFDLRWNVPDMDPTFTPARLDSWPLGTVVEGVPVVWQTKQIRVDRDKAVFGEISFDVSDHWTLVAGYRWFEYENSLFGFNGSLDRCLDANDQPQYACFDHPNLDDVSKGNGDSVKLSLNYNIDDDRMIYATYSEGFRAGGVNRASVPGIAKYEPDYVDNYELGWKTTWLDGQLRWNGSAYLLEWEDFQFSFLDFAVSPLTIIQNIGQARTIGAEFDLAYAATSDLTLTLSGSYNDAELREPYFRTAEERDSGEPPRAPEGTEMPFVPRFQFTGIGRYHFTAGNIPAYFQAAVSYTDDSWNNLETALRTLQPAYTLVNVAAGIETDTWTLDLFINNLTDKRAQIVRYDANYFDPFDEVLGDTVISVNRPRTIGISYGRRF